MNRNNHNNLLAAIAIVFAISFTFIACRKEASLASLSNRAEIEKTASVKPLPENTGLEAARFVGGIGWGRPTRQCDGHGICIIWDRTPDTQSPDNTNKVASFAPIDNGTVRIGFLESVNGQPGEVIHGFDEPPVAFSPMVTQSLGYSELYLLPGEYPIMVNDEYPFGYIDVKVGGQ